MSVSRFLVLIFALNLTNLISQQSFFMTSPMIDNYKGIIKNGDDIICYGNQTITYIDSEGNISKEKKIANDIVKKIATFDSEIFGITEKTMFRSYYQDSYWLAAQLPDNTIGCDIKINNNEVYLLTNNGIFLSDLEMTINNYPLIPLPKDKKYSNLEADNNFIYFIVDSTTFFRYNIKTKEVDTTDIIDELKLFDYKITSLNSINKKLYIKVTKHDTYGNIYSQIIYSGDYGKTWKKRTPIIINTSNFNLINDKFYFLSTSYSTIEGDNSYTPIFQTVLSALDSNQFNIDSTYFRIITTDNVPKRYMVYYKDIRYKDFIKYNDTIIGVGDNKLISKSVNGGKSFDYISYFNGFTLSFYDNYKILNDSIIFNINSYQINKTTDGGITWLPPKFIPLNPDIVSLPNIFDFDNKGFGFAKYKKIYNKIDSNIIEFKNFGDDFSVTDNPSLNFPVENSFNFSSIDLRDRKLFVINNKKVNNSYSYQIITMSSVYNNIDSITINARPISILKINDNKIISLNLLETGTNNPDSNGHTEDYSYDYYLSISTDQGINWDSLNIPVPFTKKLTMVQNNYYWLNTIHKNSYLIDDKVIFITNKNLIYTFDINTLEFDSLYFGGNITLNFPLTAFKLDSNLFIVSNMNNQFYYTSLPLNYQSKWDSISPENIFKTWDNFNYIENKSGKNTVLGVKMFSEKRGILVTGKSYIDNKPPYSTYFSLNFQKIESLKPVNVRSDNIEHTFDYLYTYPPYPTPSTDHVNILTYFDITQPFDLSKVYVTDIYGAKVSTKSELSFEPQSNYKGIITWDCSSHPNGIYFVVLTHGTTKKAVKVMVGK